MMGTLAGGIKRVLLATRHYARALRDAVFPGVAVLCYHGIRRDDAPAGRMVFENLHVRASVLDAHCRIVRDLCDPISLDDWRAALAGRAPLPPRPVLITFDDGYRSIVTDALPILDAYSLPAAVFVCSDPIARRGMLWFDAVGEREGEEGVQRWKTRPYHEWRMACADTPAVADDDPRALLRVDELRTLAASDRIELGAHTARHPILATASASSQRQEIVESIEAIAHWTGRPIRAFAYPNGRPGIDYGGDTVEIVRSCGIDVAFTMAAAFAAPGDPLERSRFMMLDEISGPELAHRLAYSWPR